MRRMEILHVNLIFIALILVAACTHAVWSLYKDIRLQRLERSKIIADTVLLCGSQSVCNQSVIPFPLLLETEKQISICAPCRCDVDCWARGDCCVDLPYLYLTSSCQSSQFIFNGSKAEISSEFNFEMITSCPETNVGVEMNEQCDGYQSERSLLDNDLQVPVTSVITHITYRNKYCAHCHGDYDVIRWDSLAKCDTPFDINIISTMNGFKDAFSKYNCSLHYDFPSSQPHILPKPCVTNKYNNYVISTCNKTGLWTDYEPNIEWACENFKPEDNIFQDFRNIFCYLCNPSIATVHQDVIIDRCNLTGEWQFYDRGLEDACLSLPSSQRMRPFKNPYCMLCNGRNPLSNTLQGHLGNLTFIISNYLSVSSAHIQFSETSLLQLLGSKDTYLEVSMAEFDVQVEDVKSEFVNGDHTKNTPKQNTSYIVGYNVLKDLQLICGKDSVCLNSDQDEYSTDTNWSHPNSPCGICDCNKKCLYDKTCCVGLLLNENPYEPISKELFPWARDQNKSSDNGLLAISTCRNIKNINQLAFIRDMCHQQAFSNLISLLPGTSNGSVIFKNIFCSYCHDFKDNFQPLDIKIMCPIPLEPTMFLSFSSFFKIALQRKCNIRVFDDYDDAFRKNTLIISKCNTTGEWHDYVESVQNMCELEKQFVIYGLSPMEYHNKIYKNIFCFLCNPEISTQSAIRHCNVTGNWNIYDPVLEEACEQAPEHNAWYPYKNWFCSRCNEETVIARRIPPDVYDAFIPTYRSLFSFKLPLSDDLKKDEITCSNGTYDIYKMACANVYCPAGRVLRNETCDVLLEETKNLRYVITFQVVSISNQGIYNSKIHILLQNISSTITDIMCRLEGNWKIEYKAWSYQPCEERNMADNATILIKIPTIFFQVKLHILYTRNRTELESALLDCRSAILEMQDNGGNLLFEIAQNSVIVPEENNNNTICRHDYEEFNNNNFEYSIFSVSEDNEYEIEYRHVSNLLKCVMVQVSNTDYVYNNQTETIKLLNSSTILQRQDFEFQTDGSIRVCRDNVNQWILTYQVKTLPALSYQESLMASIHNIFSYVCTILSIICLVVTFVTYCLFKSLRSLPGKNNMCLVLCLLCAQILLQYGLWQNRHPILCQVLAIGIHFFWMATFSSMNVCSFHMYRVFCTNVLAILPEGDSMKVFMKYSAYICTVPFLSILITIIINSSLSNGNNTGYGGERCFLNNQYSVIFAFIIPSVAIFISNAILFAIAFHKIRSSPIIESNSKDKRNLFMYAKLSTITGIAWPVQIIDGMMELSVFSFFATFINALQGVFIFASYICNKRVWKMYVDLCCRKEKPQESRSHFVSRSSKSGTEQTFA